MTYLEHVQFVKGKAINNHQSKDSDFIKMHRDTYYQQKDEDDINNIDDLPNSDINPFHKDDDVEEN